MSSFLSHKVQVSQSPTSGQGLFALEKISKNELIADYRQGRGKYVDDAESDRLFHNGFDHMIQVGMILFLPPHPRMSLKMPILLIIRVIPMPGSTAR